MTINSLHSRLDTDLSSLVRRAARGQAASQQQLRDISRLKSERWETVVRRTELGAGYRDTARSFFTVGSTSGRGPFTHLRLNIFPDGGVARLRVYGVSVPLLPLSSSPSSPLELSSARLGGLCLGYSDAHYGHPRNIIKTDLAANMGDGWETARRLDRPAVLVADQAGILQGSVETSHWSSSAEILRSHWFKS